MKYPYAAASHGALKAGRHGRALALFQKGLTYRLGESEPSINVYLRFSQHAYLHSQLDMLDLAKDYKCYLRSLVYRHEKDYHAAWKTVEGIGDERLIPLKVKILCDMREKDKLMALSNEGVDVLSYLELDRQKSLITAMVRNHETAMARKIIDRTKLDRERLYALLDTESYQPVIKYSWQSIKEEHLNVEADPLPEDLPFLLERVDMLETSLQHAAYVHLINHFHDRPQYHRILNTHTVPFIEDNPDLLEYITIEARYSLKFKTESLGPATSQLDMLLGHYHSGNHSRTVTRAIHQILPEVKLNDSYIRSIRKMVLDGNLDLYNERLIHLFKEDKEAYKVFQYPALFLNTSVNRAVDNYVHFHFPSRIRERIFRPLVVELVESTEKTTLPRYFVNYLQRTRHKKLSNMYILVRHTYRKGDRVQVEDYVRELVPDKQFKLRLYLAKYLYGFNELEDALAETKAAERLNSQDAELYQHFIKIYKRMGDTENLLKYTVKMKTDYPKKLSDSEYEKVKAAHENSNNDRTQSQ
ncbi:hypothetical protein GQ671_07350 [Salinicoccus hispanicus]|uniref:Tetratricopeptide repeat protein n=2 Tax=Salinicoccus hispanicus TaxID=157225 RepID=A0A6N8U3R7_9STAP|nr:hypothetical protein [Salinicoccus hispanicus]MXQ51085.1 hypothetical protein [Salinicoccus hispanicus]